MTTYKRAIATALVAATMTITLGACGPTKDTGATYASVCPSPTEDSPITCKLDPSKRYDYGHGAWFVVPDDYRHANGNRPPLGSELLATYPTTDADSATESSYDGRG